MGLTSRYFSENHNMHLTAHATIYRANNPNVSCIFVFHTASLACARESCQVAALADRSQTQCRSAFGLQYFKNLAVLSVLICVHLWMNFISLCRTFGTQVFWSALSPSSHEPGWTSPYLRYSQGMPKAWYNLAQWRQPWEMGYTMKNWMPTAWHRALYRTFGLRSPSRTLSSMNFYF